MKMRKPIEPELAELGGVIRLFREEAMMSLRDFAKKSGYSYGYLSKIERGERGPGRETLEHLLLCLGIEPHHRNHLLLKAGFGLSSNDQFLAESAFKCDPETARDSLNSIVLKAVAS